MENSSRPTIIGDTMPHNPALLLIDIQQGFQNAAWWGSTRNNPWAEAPSAPACCNTGARGNCPSFTSATPR